MGEGLGDSSLGVGSGVASEVGSGVASEVGSGVASSSGESLGDGVLVGDASGEGIGEELGCEAINSMALPVSDGDGSGVGCDDSVCTVGSTGAFSSARVDTVEETVIARTIKIEARLKCRILGFSLLVKVRSRSRSCSNLNPKFIFASYQRPLEL